MSPVRREIFGNYPTCGVGVPTTRSARAPRGIRKSRNTWIPRRSGSTWPTWSILRIQGTLSTWSARSARHTRFARSIWSAQSARSEQSEVPDCLEYSDFSELSSARGKAVLRISSVFGTLGLQINIDYKKQPCVLIQCGVSV